MIINNFIQKLALPDLINDAINTLQKELKKAKFSLKNAKKNGLLRFLKKYQNLNIFGFNSSKYDLKCLAPYIYSYCAKRNLKPNILKVTFKFHAFLSLII